MRVAKKIIAKNDKTALVSKIFDECLRELSYQLFDRIELHLQKEDKIKLEFPVAHIFLNYNDPYIQSMDKRAIKIIILRKLITLIIANKYIDKKIPEFIVEIMSNREIIRKGFDRDLFYYYYLFLMQYEPHKVQELSTFIKINIPWLSYYGLDNYDSKSMKKLTEKFKYDEALGLKTKKLFLAVKKDLLKGKNLDNAIEAYNTIDKR